MTVEGIAAAVVEFVREHQAWTSPTVFVLAFAESLAFISLLVPAWSALVGIGTLIEKSFEGGRAALANLNLPVESLVCIVSMDNGQIVFGD